jgi:hypothetical protein
MARADSAKCTLGTAIVSSSTGAAIAIAGGRLYLLRERDNCRGHGFPSDHVPGWHLGSGSVRRQ